MLQKRPVYINLPLMSLVSDKNEKQNPAWWTLIGTWMVLAIFSWAAGGFAPFFQIAGYFLAGDLANVRSYGSVPAAPIVTATVVVMVPVMLATLPLLSKLLSATDTNKVIHSKSQFVLHMLVEFGEELIFRFFFLGILSNIPGLGSNGAFYFLLLTGNIIWVALHLMTLRKADRKKWPIVLPMFLGGIMFSMVYTSHGFFAAVMTHMIYDMVMFSVYCRTPFWWKKFKLLCLYHLLWFTGGLACFLIMSSHTLSDVWHMFLHVSAKQDLPSGWNSIDYMLAAILVISAVHLLLEILWYDREQEATARKVKRNLLLSGVFLLLSYPVLLGLEALFPEYFMVIATGSAILLISLEKTSSSSGIARLFWKSLLAAQLFSILQALNLAAIFSLTTLFVLYQTGVRVVRYGYSFYPIRYAFIQQRLLFWSIKTSSPKHMEALDWVMDRIKDQNLTDLDRDFYLRGARFMLAIMKSAENQANIPKKKHADIIKAE